MGDIVESPKVFLLLCRGLSYNSLRGRIPSFGCGNLQYLWVDKCILYVCGLKHMFVENARDRTQMYQTLYTYLGRSPYHNCWWDIHAQIYEHNYQVICVCPCDAVDTICFIWHRCYMKIWKNKNCCCVNSSSGILMTICWMEGSPIPWKLQVSRFVSTMMCWECKGLIMMLASSVVFIVW